MAIARRSRGDQNWQSSHRVWYFSSIQTDPRDRSLEDIGTRSLALSEKGKVARVLDKAQDSQEVIKLVEKLRQAILVYQVSAKHRQSRKSLTRGAGVTTTVHIQPGRPSDREFLPLISDFKTKLAIGRSKSSFDVLLKLHQVRKYVRDGRPRVTFLQKSPVKNKIESVRARLDRLGAEGETTRNADEFRRRKCLFEWVLSIGCEQPSMLNRSQNSRGDQGQVAASV